MTTSWTDVSGGQAFHEVAVAAVAREFNALGAKAGCSALDWKIYVGTEWSDCRLRLIGHIPATHPNPDAELRRWTDFLEVTQAFTHSPILSSDAPLITEGSFRGIFEVQIHGLDVDVTCRHSHTNAAAGDTSRADS
jgi:hypothetical protein